MALRVGSLKGAADRLGITAAAVGQRVRALETYLGTDLLVRGRSGLRPTAELDLALSDLHSAFSALDRVTEALDFQRVTEIHMVADPDWAELWLLPRLQAFQADNPNIRFCINGAGDVPLRLGAPDIRVEYGQSAKGEDLYCDLLVPVSGPDNLRRLADWDKSAFMEGLPLLHLQAQRDDPERPGWPDWFAAFGHRREGLERGVFYPNARVALEAVREEVGYLVCGLSLIEADLSTGAVVLPFASAQHLIAPAPFRMSLREGAAQRPQVTRFLDWLRAQALATQKSLRALADS